jgi:hypothetical protein
LIKITEAGNLGAISIFETELRPPKYRNPKQNSSTLAQQRKNDWARLQKQIYLIDKNFSRENSEFYMLTFRRKDKDPSVVEALILFHNFIRRLKRHCPGVRFCAVIHLGSRRGRPHFHMIVNCTDRAIIATLWKHGRVFRKKITTQSLMGIVMYMYSGALKTRNKSVFINSRNLIKPCNYVREIKIPYKELLKIINEAGVHEETAYYYKKGENPYVGNFLTLYVEADQFDRICKLIMERET